MPVNYRPSLDLEDPFETQLSPLLRLPKELRLAIIEYTVPALDLHYRLHEQRPFRWPKQPPLACTCRLLREECLPYFYAGHLIPFDLDSNTSDDYLDLFATTPGFTKIRTVAVLSGLFINPVNGLRLSGLRYTLDLEDLSIGAHGFVGAQHHREYANLGLQLQLLLQVQRHRLRFESRVDFLWKVLELVRESGAQEQNEHAG